MLHSTEDSFQYSVIAYTEKELEKRVAVCVCGPFLIAQLVKNPPAMQKTLVHSWVRKIPQRRARLLRLKFGRPGFDSWVGKIPWTRAWQPTPVFLTGESHGQRSLGGYSPLGYKEWDMPKQRSTAQYICVCVTDAPCWTAETDAML